MDRLESNIVGFLRSGEGDFERTALGLFAYQYEKNPPYRAYCRMQGIAPEKIDGWQDIPAAPIGAFKSTELATFPAGRAAAIFESSGTTRQVKSRHFLKTLTYYETSLKTSFTKAVLSDNAKLPFLILTPSPAEAPRSSLSWMMDVVKRSYGAPRSAYVVTRGRLDELHLATLLAQAETTGQPVALLGTTIAFLGFFDFATRAGKKYKLASGSRLMDTGGLKTEKWEIARPTFVRQADETLSIPESACFNEYGMCELSSQFYGRGASSYLAGPPWTRTLVMDPATGRPAPRGTPGLLRHFDLANVDSVLAVQTEDVGISVLRPTSDVGRETWDGFILQGRDPSAEVKGCSLSAEAFVS